MSDLPEHAQVNRAAWDEWAKEYEEAGHLNWSSKEPSWGIWGVPESELPLLPEDMSGLDAIELGCGTGYVSAWMTRRGASVVGIDNSQAQLATAKRFQQEFGLDFPLLHGNAEEVPRPDSSFDFAISEYGASIWCDPYRWIPEAARLLRPGGQLVFLVNSSVLMLCMPDEGELPAGSELIRPLFGLHRIQWPDDGSVNFYLPHGETIRLLRDSGFEVEDMIEVRPPEGSTTRHPLASLEWARKWPTEDVWKARKRDD
jgi:SAM-dependent methyltransferase